MTTAPTPTQRQTMNDYVTLTVVAAAANIADLGPAAFRFLTDAAPPEVF